MTKKWQIVVPDDFEATENEYKINNKSYLRVTHTLGIIAEWRIENWKNRIGQEKANKILETRQAIGTHVHKLIELTLKNKKYNLSAYENEIQEGLCRFYEFKDLAKLKPEGLEQRLWSNKHGYAGTADYIGYYQSVPKFMVRGHEPKFSKPTFVIGDWKTGRDIYPKYWLQLTAYVKAFEELTGIKVKGVFIARIRNGRIKVKEKTYVELMKEFDLYLCALKLYKWKYGKDD